MSNTITLSYTNNFQPICVHKTEKSPNESLRIHCVSVRFNKEELEILNSNRGNKSKGEWLHKLPVIVPEINVETWKSLSYISQKLNKLINHLDANRDFFSQETDQRASIYTENRKASREAFHENSGRSPINF